MIISLIRKIRAIVMRTIFPRKSYIRSASTKPISTKYGYDRGTPVDRFYIEKFMSKYASIVKGKCLEIVDDSYTMKYGADKVTESDVLDIIKRPTTTIHGDLRDLHGVIADNTYDTLIITQTLNVIDDYEATIAESYRILKPGGTLLVTLPTISPAWNLPINSWRFTAESSRYVFEKHFSPEKVEISSLGNRAAVECFWLGMALEDMSADELTDEDATFPLTIGIAARK